MYSVYIRPIFEYVCEVWDNCGKCHSSKLEKIQLDAARIVTGLPIFTRLILHISKLAGNHYIVGVTEENFNCFIRYTMVLHRNICMI